jgi:diguanylate cyclase (GGDEF)-like protein
VNRKPSRAAARLPRPHLPTRPQIIAAAVALAWMTAAAAGAPQLRLNAGDGSLLAVLIACALLVELPGHGHGAPRPAAGGSGAWELPAAVLLPPALAFTVPAAVIAITSRRIRSLGAVTAGMADGLVSAGFHAVAPPLGASGTRAGEWLAAVVAAGVIRWALADVLVPAVTGAARLPRALAGRELLRGALAELCAGVLVTCSAVLSPLCVILAVPLATPLRRSLQHARLVRDARTDTKTGLLNAGAWQEDAAAEITRALRARLPLAMAMLDIDHFKAVNDTHGHLAGDQALRAVAGVVRTQLRAYDIAGRIGGEEFAVLLPHTQPAQARRIAERLRTAIAAASFDAGGPGGHRAGVRVTVSVGVASLADAGPGLQALLAAADAALYDAKAAGRNRVRAWHGQPPDTAGPARSRAGPGHGTPVLEAAPHR